MEYRFSFVLFIGRHQYLNLFISKCEKVSVSNERGISFDGVSR